MRAYEVMIIIDTDVDDAGVRQVLARVGELVGAEGGTVATSDTWGRRRFAYEINKKHEGIYVVLQITTSATNLDSLDRVRTTSSATRSFACPTRKPPSAVSSVQVSPRLRPGDPDRRSPWLLTTP